MSRMASFYEPQVAQVNEKSPLKSLLYLTLTQHSRDEDLKSRAVCTCLEVEPPQAWYYCIFSNSRTLVVLL
jgi:hypothetical protein